MDKKHLEQLKAMLENSLTLVNAALMENGKDGKKEDTKEDEKTNGEMRTIRKSI